MCNGGSEKEGDLGQAGESCGDPQGGLLAAATPDSVCFLLSIDGNTSPDLEHCLPGVYNERYLRSVRIENKGTREQLK